MLKHLRIKLTIICATITAVILMLMALFVQAVNHGQQEKNQAEAFRSSYRSIVFYLQSETVLDYSWVLRTEKANQLILYLEDNGTPLQITSASKKGTPLAYLIDKAQEAAQLLGFSIDMPPSTSIAEDSVFYQIYDDKGNRFKAACAAIPTRNGWLGMTLLKDMRSEDAANAEQRRLLFIAAAVGTLLLALFSWWFAGIAIRPVEDSYHRQTQFIADAGHELRTPLSVIQASASAILQATPEQTQRFAQAIGKECKNMARLVNDLLLLARADAKTWSIHLSVIDVETLLISQYELFERVAADKGIRLSVKLDEERKTSLKMIGDEERLGQVVSILLDNAISYTPRGGKILLYNSISENAVNIVVEDTGPGITDEAKEHIFDRFYRADTSRTGKNHYGLGLSIAYEIMRLHKGKINVQDRSGGGSKFILSLPAETV